MKTNEARFDLGFSSEEIPKSPHICLIYENEEQRRKIVSEYLIAGIKQGQLVRYFSDFTPWNEIRKWFEETGIDVEKIEKEGTFLIKDAETAYCPHGHFNPPEVIESMKERYVIAEKSGYSGSRVSGEMSWALRNIPGSERILEYETLINSINVSFPHVGMCQYDARKFDGATLFKVLQIHPFIIAQGQVVQNPYYQRES